MRGFKYFQIYLKIQNLIQRKFSVLFDDWPVHKSKQPNESF